MILIIIFSVILFFIVWTMFLKPFEAYYRAYKAFGRKGVAIYYAPLTPLPVLHKSLAEQKGDSFWHLLQLTKKNPQIKVIVYQCLLFTCLFFVDSGLIKQYSTQHNQTSKKAFLAIYSKDLFMGLLGMEGQEWKRARKLLSNMFHFEALKTRETPIAALAKLHTQDLDKSSDIDLYNTMCKITAQTLVMTLFGEQFNSIKMDGKYAYQMVEHILSQLFVVTLQFGSIFRITFFGDIRIDSKYLTKYQKVLRDEIIGLKKFCRRYLQAQLQKCDNGEQVPQFIQLYHKNAKEYFNPAFKQNLDMVQQMIMQLSVFLGAGQDSTAISIVLALYELARQQDWQHRLRQQYRTVDNIHTSQVINNFIHQCIRLHNPVMSTLDRNITKASNLGGMKLRAGDRVILATGFCNLNPIYFEDPQTFNPDRFNNSQITKHFIPFYVGPRNCIGQHLAMIEIRLVLKQILLSYRLTRTQVELKQVSYFVLNKPLNSKLVKFQKI